MRNFVVLFSVFTGLAVTSTALTPGAPSKAKKTVFADIKPILAKSCVQCHMGAKPAHGLDLTSFANVRKGDPEGKVVVPNKPSKSRLVTVLHGKPQLMPPGAKLDKALAAKLEAWVKDGAKEK